MCFLRKKLNFLVIYREQLLIHKCNHKYFVHIVHECYCSYEGRQSWKKNYTNTEKMTFITKLGIWFSLREKKNLIVTYFTFYWCCFMTFCFFFHFYCKKLIILKYATYMFVAKWKDLFVRLLFMTMMRFLGFWSKIFCWFGIQFHF